MKILIISRGIPSKRYPQEGCFEWDQARALQRIGHQPVVVSLDSRVRKSGHHPGLRKIDVDGIPFYQGYWGDINIIEKFINARLAYKIFPHLYNKLFKRVLADHPDIDVVHSHFLYISVNAVPAIRKYGLPLVVTEHWSELEKDNLLPIVKYLGDNLYKHCTRIISVSSSLQKRLEDHFNAESVVLHNMIGTEFEETEIKPHTPAADGKFRFVTVGSLIKRKGFDFLIESFARSGLKDRAEVVIIGDGKIKGELNRQIREAGLEGSITLAGPKQKPEIIEMLKTGDAFVLPSRAENFSVAVLEALTIGLPVIATICGGIRECIDESNGLLVPVDDTKAMSEALRKMVDTASSYDRETIRREALEKYGPTHIAGQLAEILQQAASDNGHNNKRD